ncbi:MAG: exodeoxyribonuclease VII small subunit [Candidatus Sumerlaeaceae bacterium]|jgi:exodeoxyribonuclease VII small subunit
MENEAGNVRRGRSKKQEVPVDQLPLDKCFQELEQIVESLERENVSLEESLRLFERGMALSRRCLRELEAIEQRIEMIVEDSKEGVRTVTFETPENETEADE